MASTSSRRAAARTRRCPAIPTARRTPAGRNVQQVSFSARRYGEFRIPHDQKGRIGLKGTSMAAPHVTGVVALLLAAGVLGPNPTPQQIARRLTETARDLGAPGPDRYYAAGLVDAAAALRGTPASSRP